MSGKKHKNELKKYFNKSDLVLLIVLLLFGAVSFLASNIIRDAGQSVSVTVDGEVYGVYPLGFDREISVDTQYGHNLVSISDNRASVKESDCPNHDCEGFGAISKAGQTILCIPHHMSVSIIGETDVDAVVS